MFQIKSKKLAITEMLIFILSCTGNLFQSQKYRLNLRTSTPLVPQQDHLSLVIPAMKKDNLFNFDEIILDLQAIFFSLSPIRFSSPHTCWNFCLKVQPWVKLSTIKMIHF